MRCNCCEYAQYYVGEGSGYYEEDTCTLCSLTNEDEQTENKQGLGCIFNKRTLNKRKRRMDAFYKEMPYLG